MDICELMVGPSYLGFEINEKRFWFENCTYVPAYNDLTVRSNIFIRTAHVA